MKKYTLLLSVLFLFAVSCKKESTNTAQTKKEQLTKAPWVYQNGGLDLGKDGNIDFTFEVAGVPPACLLDNKATFNADGTGVSDEGTTKCDPSLPQTSAFNWAFANNETQLTISGNGFAGLTGTMTIKTLSETSLGLTKDTVILGAPSAVVLNLKH